MEFHDAKPRCSNDKKRDEDLPIHVQTPRRGQNEPYPEIISRVECHVVDQTPRDDAVVRGDPPPRNVEEILPRFRVREGGADLFARDLHGVAGVLGTSCTKGSLLKN